MHTHTQSLTLDPHGNSFFQGVKFSVQTISRGSVAYLRKRWSVPLSSTQKQNQVYILCILSWKLFIQAHHKRALQNAKGD